MGQAKRKAGMFKMPEQEYTAEFKELAVKRVKSGEAVGGGREDRMRA